MPSLHSCPTVELKARRLFLREEKLIARARRDLLAFTLYTKEDYAINWHHRALADALNAFARGEIRFLMVFMPPRHGKSELVSRRFPAFLHGLYPDAEIMAASYLDSLAGDMCIDVQNIIDSPAYQRVFPETKIYQPGTRYTVGTRNSSEHHIVGRKGKYRGQGVGGSFTGKGCNFCHLHGTRVFTDSGEMDIQDVKVGDLVWSFNHESNKTELNRVEKLSSRVVSKLVQIETAGGNKVLCTPEHPFWIEGRGYCAASEIKQGEWAWVLPKAENSYLQNAMHVLREAIREAEIRVRKAIKKRACGLLLLDILFKKPSQRKEQKELPELREPSQKKITKILQFWMQAGQKTREGNKEKRLSEIIPVNQSFNYFKRWFPVFCMRNIANKAVSSSHKRKQNGSFCWKSNNSLSCLPRKAPSLERDKISSIREISGGEIFTVYNLQVAGNNNFFAGNILNHNCIIDDPIKGREIADSEAFRERLWNFYNNDLFTRLETDLKTGRQGQVLLTVTRWHEDDLSGRLIELMKKSSEAVQWEIINYPAIRVDMDTPSDPRKIGEALWPEKYNLESLQQIKSSAGPRAWSSLYQQDPVPDGGGQFKDRMFEFADLPDRFDYVFTTADTAYKEKDENDFQVISSWGYVISEDKLYHIDNFQQQMKAVDVEVPFRGFIQQYRSWGFRYAWIEPKGHGIYLNQKFASEGLPIPHEDDLKEFYGDRRLDKVERAANAVPHLANRKIYINKKLANKEEIVAEALRFPKTKHDDWTDTLIDAIKVVYGKALTVWDNL